MASTSLSRRSFIRRSFRHDAHEGNLNQFGGYSWFVAIVANDVRNLGHQRLPIHYLAEDRVVAVSGWIFIFGDEELAGRRSWPRIRHRQAAGPVELEPLNKLIGKLESTIVRPGPGGISGLDHEVRDYAMEDQILVQGLRGRFPGFRVQPGLCASRQANEGANGDGRLFLDNCAVITPTEVLIKAYSPGGYFGASFEGASLEGAWAIEAAPIMRRKPTILSRIILLSLPDVGTRNKPGPR